MSEGRGVLDLRSAVALVEAAVRSAGKSATARRTAAAMVSAATTVVVRNLVTFTVAAKPVHEDAQPTVSLAKAARLSVRAATLLQG